jgi:hypothetical protein
MKLLVSPRNVEEAIQAVKGGADIIDVKNPAEGSLGANFPWVIKKIKENLPERTEISATLGDLDFKPGLASLAAFGLAKLGVNYVKAGLFKIENAEQVQKMAESITKAVNKFGVRVVLACYADRELSPFEISPIAHKTGAYGVMIDTAKKDGRNLLDHLNIRELQRFVNISHSLNLRVALAGSLGMKEILKIKKIAPDIIGIRGLVCEGDRINGYISAEKVREVKKII